MINLNKQIPSKKEILKHISDVDIYTFYTGEEPVFNRSMISPLRDENNPSFGYFIGDNDEICFNDYVLGGGDCIKFVQLKYGFSYYKALSKISIDFGLENYFFIDDTVKKESKNKPLVVDREEIISKAKEITLKKTARPWRDYDLIYWRKYEINRKILDLYNVEPISYFFIKKGDSLFTYGADMYAYCFTEYKDNKETYKIYQPYNKKVKWRSSHDASVWQGWNQLSEKGDILIITKSLKDVMAIRATTSFDATSLQAESSKPKEHVLEQLKNRFKRIYVLYDNDFNSDINWGQKFAIKLTSQYSFIDNIVIHNKYKCKDYSDLVNKYGGNKSLEILKESIQNALPF